MLQRCLMANPLTLVALRKVARKVWENVLLNLKPVMSVSTMEGNINRKTGLSFMDGVISLYPPGGTPATPVRYLQQSPDYQGKRFGRKSKKRSIFTCIRQRPLLSRPELYIMYYHRRQRR